MIKMYDLNTKNESFLDMSNELASFGIKNNKIMLRLDNPKLAGVDPFNPNLSMEMQTAIIEECKSNIWYFFREIVKFPPDFYDDNEYEYEIDRSDFKLTRHACDFLYAIEHNISRKILINVPRQIGKTTLASIFALWEALFVDNIDIIEYAALLPDACPILNFKNGFDLPKFILKYAKPINMKNTDKYSVKIRNSELFADRYSWLKKGGALPSNIVILDDVVYYTNSSSIVADCINTLIDAGYIILPTCANVFENGSDDWAYYRDILINGYYTSAKEYYDATPDKIDTWLIIRYDIHYYVSNFDQGKMKQQIVENEFELNWNF